VPQVIPETPNQLRRYEGAQRRRENREAEAARRKQAQLETATRLAAESAGK
jgi:transcription elongation GreA/GreB family factor